MASMPPLTRADLELHAEIDTADNSARYRWEAGAPDSDDRLIGITCGSTIMNGYANASCSLPRDINRSYNDLGLLDTFRLVGNDGTIAYEGRGARYPREATQTTQHINVEAVGWMAHARDKPIVFLGLDQDMSSWVQMTAARQAVLQVAAYAPRGSGTVMSDKTLSQSFDGAWVANEVPIIEAWFDAGPGQTIGRIYFEWTRGINVAVAASWFWSVAVYDDTSGGGEITPGNFQDVGPGAGDWVATAVKRYAAAHFYTQLASGGTDGVQYNLDWNALQVIGGHGLPLQGAGPFSILNSDIIKHVAAVAAPLLNTSGVQPGVPIDQFAIRDLTDPYDIWLKANAPTRWNLAVWDDKRLVFEAFPDVRQLQTADWVLRSDHPNSLRRGYDGPTTDGQKNGAIVRFQNIQTGAADMINPSTHTVLADTDTRLAANRAGIDDWARIQLPNPTTAAQAALTGAAALGEFNRQRTPGRFTLTGFVMDDATNWHQGWKLRAGQTVLLEQDEDDPVRLIHEVSWNHDSREVTINADAASRTIDAILVDMGFV
jgi:hypothetical protein